MGTAATGGTTTPCQATERQCSTSNQAIKPLTCMGRSGYLACNSGINLPQSLVFRRSGKALGRLASVRVVVKAPFEVADHLFAR